MTHTKPMRYVAAVLALLALAPAAFAQQLRGTVVDGASGIPIAGAVVQFLDASGAALGRGITDGQGTFHLLMPEGMVRMQVLRIGFRPHTRGIANVHDKPLRIAMERLPTILEPVNVADETRCPRRSDRPAALGLWEQARAGLLATVVARESAPAKMKIIEFDRFMAGNTQRIEWQNVRLDTISGRTPFAAARSSTDFVQAGFSSAASDGRWFHGPDADVLLSESFAGGYCFHLARPDRSRPNQAGLAFVSGSRVPERIDIEGTLWVDTVSRELRDVEFRYAGLDRRTDAYRPGGYIGFRQLGNGVVVIDRWHLRLLAARADTTRDHSNRDAIRVWYDVAERGGELASAAFPSGYTWRASLGTLRGRTVALSGRPAPGVFVRLDSTSYSAVSDADGAFTIDDLLPGPYVASVVHPTFIPIGIVIPTPLRFTAARGTIQLANLTVATPEEYVEDRCLFNKNVRDPVEGDAWVLARVMNAQGDPERGVTWEIRTLDHANVAPVSDGLTGSDGLLEWCRLKLGTRVEIRAARGPQRSSVITELKSKLTVLPIYLPER